MDNSTILLQIFAKERPVGTEMNEQLLSTVETLLADMGYSIECLHFDCSVWEKGLSTMKIGSREIIVEPNPYSEPFKGSGRICKAGTVEELQTIDCQGAILLLAGELTQEPLSPKDYPFYYPDEHKCIITTLEQKQPAAIVAATGSTTIHGKTPFPYIEDGNFILPSASISMESFAEISSLLGEEISANLIINSSKSPARSRQIVACKRTGNSKGRIVIAAHMDSKYDTPATLDNAAGVAVLLKVAASVSASMYDVDIVPFNSEEYYGATGEVEYIDWLGDEKIALMINIDSPCHKGSKTAISFYNFTDTMQAYANATIASNPIIVKGDEWYAGDHAPFLFRGIPCMAAISSDFYERAFRNTHTPKDTLDTVDAKLVSTTSDYLVGFINGFR